MPACGRQVGERVEDERQRLRDGRRGELREPGRVREQRDIGTDGRAQEDAQLIGEHDVHGRATPGLADGTPT